MLAWFVGEMLAQFVGEMSDCFVGDVSYFCGWDVSPFCGWDVGLFHEYWPVLWPRCQPVLWVRFGLFCEWDVSLFCGQHVSLFCGWDISPFMDEMSAGFVDEMVACYVDEMSACFVDINLFCEWDASPFVDVSLFCGWGVSPFCGRCLFRGQDYYVNACRAPHLKMSPKCLRWQVYSSVFCIVSLLTMYGWTVVHFQAEMSFCGWKVSLFCLWAAVGQVCRWQVCLFNGWEVSLIYGRNRHGIALFICTDQGGLLIARKTILHPKPGWGPFKYYDMSRDTTTNNYAWYSMCPITKDKLNINESFTLSRR